MKNYNPFSLEGKVILITGASSGIGRSIAIECSRMGAKIIVTARNEGRLQETISMMDGNEHIALKLDLNDEQSIIDVVDKIPVVNGVVHNAGMGDRSLCKMVKSETIDNVMSTNFRGPVLLQKYLLKKKKIAKEGSIVFMASRAPMAPTIGNSMYAASKGAVLAYSKVLALEVSPQLIRVNCICPAMVWTELVARDAAITGANYEEAQKTYPLKRYGKPEDIAHLAIYLLSDASCWMTGSSIDITGGAVSL